MYFESTVSDVVSGICQTSQHSPVKGIWDDMAEKKDPRKAERK